VGEGGGVAGDGNDYRRADPGESTEETELYDPFRTPSSAYIEWGTGVDLYFSTLRIMAFLLLLAGIINIPNILFYRSKAYSPDGKDGLGVFFTLSSSAVCTTPEWVVCSDCSQQGLLNLGEEQGRFINATDGTILVQRNACDGGQFTQGMINYGTAFFLTAAITLMSMYLRAREIRADEDK